MESGEGLGGRKGILAGGLEWVDHRLIGRGGPWWVDADGGTGFMGKSWSVS